MVFFVVKSHAKWAPFKPYLNHLLEIFFSAPACFKTHLMMTVTFVRHSCNDSRLLYVETALIKVHCTVGKIQSEKIMKYNFLSIFQKMSIIADTKRGRALFVTKLSMSGF